MAKKVSVSINLQGNYLAVIKKAQRYTSSFDKDVKKMTADLDKARKKKVDIAIKDSKARKVISSLEKKLAPMRNVMVKVAANVAHFKNQIRPVENTLKKVAGKAWSVTVKLKDSVSGALAKLKNGLKTAGAAIAISLGTAVAAGSYALRKGMTLESYGVSMEHFVGVNNPKASRQQISDMTKGYMDWLKQNAVETPFSADDVMGAGSRAVQIAEGNTDAAKGLLKMSEDMAALTPNKTVLDAMEALADAQMGEFERLKEFGFKGTAENFKKAGGDLFSMKGTTGLTLFEIFSGGTDKFKNTLSGQWQAAVGDIEDQIGQIGLDMVEALKPFLGWITDTVIPDIKAFVTDPIKGGTKTGLQTLTDGIKDLYYWLKDAIPSAIDSIKAMWEGFATWFNDPNGILRQALGILGISLPTISTGGNPGGNGNNQNQPAGNQNTPAGGKTLTAQDAIAGFLALKGASWFTKALTGKGLIRNGGKLAWETAKTVIPIAKDAAKLGAEAASNAAITAAGASPAANAAMVGSTALLSTVLPGLPVMAGWMQDQMAVSDFEYYKKYGKLPGGPVESFAYWNKSTNDNMSKNAQAWGDNVNNTMDGLLGIKRQPNGIFPDWGATWANWMKGNTGNVAAGWMGVPAPGTQNQNAALNGGGLYGNFDLSKSLAKLQAGTSGVDAAATSINNVNTASTGASNALNTLVGWINQVKSAGGSTPRYWFDYQYQPKAAGIKRVPRDNYPALLHKGEAVLPSGEAGEYRGKGNSSGQSSKVFNVNITVNGAGLDENRLASIFVGKLQEAAANMA